MDSSRKPRVFPCNTCSITFETSELQRSHMREQWHIYNLRRRVAEQPALSEEQYDIQASIQETPRRKKDSDDPKKMPIYSASKVEDVSDPAVENEIPEKVPSTQCLFCNIRSRSIHANIDHMYSTHGLFIPSPGEVSDMESFLGYLAMIIFEYKECLYCNSEKGTVEGVQTHMRDKGHCMINMNAESELLDFWELADSEDEADNEDGEHSKKKNAAIKLSETEMRLPSGVVIGSRSDTTQLRSRPGLAQSRSKGSQYRMKRDEMKAISAGEISQTGDGDQSGPSSSNGRRVAVRGEMGLLGVSDSQRHALVVTEKKMRKREAVAKAAQRYVMEAQPVKSIYYKTENPVYQAG